MHQGAVEFSMFIMISGRSCLAVAELSPIDIAQRHSHPKGQQLRGTADVYVTDAKNEDPLEPQDPPGGWSSDDVLTLLRALVKERLTKPALA